MIEPTNDEIAFLQKLVSRNGGMALQGPASLLKIERLIPEYVLLLPASMDIGHFSLTEKGWELARKYPR
jgi:hypothetical protein